MSLHLAVNNVAADNITSSGPDVSSPGNAISGGYTGDSFTVRATIIFFCGLSLYNAIELVLLIFFTFTRFRGLYFYSLLISSICVIPYSLGFLFKLNLITTGELRWLAVTLITIGWYGMVTGQSVVLWSRLHLLLPAGEKSQRTLQWTKWMVIIDAIILHIPTTVLTYGSNGNLDTQTFINAYSIYEKIQMTGFFLQELILAAIYIKEAARLLRDSTRPDSKKFFVQLLAINVFIVILDLGLLGTEAASLYLYETIIKGTIYSIKLKLEFAVLGKLVDFAGGRPGTSTANEERWRRASVVLPWQNEDGVLRPSDGNGAIVGSAPGRADSISDFVDLSKIKTHSSQSANESALSRKEIIGAGHDVGGRQRRRRNTIRTGRGVTKDDVDLARFEYMADVHLPSDDDAAEELSNHGLPASGDV